jgi:soluble lytic murein transglycosylase-like protein
MMMPVIDVSLTCVNEAAIQYHVPAKLIIAVMMVEGGRTGQISKRNTNGSYDIGLMQINSAWIPELKKYGVTEDKIKNDACTNIKVGTWIISKKIAHGSSLTSGIGDYHSHTYHYNQIYYAKIKKSFSDLNQFLI